MKALQDATRESSRKRTKEIETTSVAHQQTRKMLQDAVAVDPLLQIILPLEEQILIDKNSLIRQT